jgi:hypothetical protein
MYYEPADQNRKVNQEDTMTDEEPLFDIIIPPGVPQKIILDIMKKFEVEVVDRREKIKFANMEGDERDLLAFRGKLEVMQKVEICMRDQLNAFVTDK